MRWLSLSEYDEHFLAINEICKPILYFTMGAIEQKHCISSSTNSDENFPALLHRLQQATGVRSAPVHLLVHFHFHFLHFFSCDKQL